MNQLQKQIVDLPLPDNFDSYDEGLKANVIEYLSQLDPIEKKAYKIAKDHLGSSFNIVKSNGFCDWLRVKGTNVIASQTL